jgi:hypothetical protein
MMSKKQKNDEIFREEEKVRNITDEEWAQFEEDQKKALEKSLQNMRECRKEIRDVLEKHWLRLVVNYELQETYLGPRLGPGRLDFFEK